MSVTGGPGTAGYDFAQAPSAVAPTGAPGRYRDPSEGQRCVA